MEKKKDINELNLNRLIIQKYLYNDKYNFETERILS